MKALWPWLSLLLLAACTQPQEGGKRGYPEAVDAGAVGPCGGDTCDANAACTGVGEDARCECVPGYSGSGTECTDVDECEDSNLNDCGANADCVNRPGRYLCECREGFSGDGRTCVGVDECEGAANVCDPNAVCTDRDPGFSCECKAGYEGSGESCTDVNECETSSLADCGLNTVCRNTPGGYTCECAAGSVRDGDACRSLCDAARADRAVCAAEGLCRIGGDSASCDACNPGFTGDGVTCAAATCAAECDGVGDDAESTVCAGDGTCRCAPGFSGAPGACVDVDECQTDGGGCGQGSTCTNLPGGHACGCQSGLFRAAGGTCEDVDECAAGTSTCHPDAICINRDAKVGPAFECSCKPGFDGSGRVCQDIDECSTDNGGCQAPAVCVNQRGSSSCECPAPLVGGTSGCHCDLSGLWAMRHDVDLCWKGRSFLEGTQQNVISDGTMEASVWELVEIDYDGTRVKMRRKGCGADNTPDLISPLFRETYSTYVPLSVFDPGALTDAEDFQDPGLVPGSPFVTPSIAAVIGLDLGDDPMNAPWPASHSDIPLSMRVDPDDDGEPGLTFWPRAPSELTDSRAAHYEYLPVRPGVGGGRLYVEQRAACVTLAARVVAHFEGEIESCTRITGRIINERTEGRVLGCTLAPKGTCNPSNPNDCTGWQQDLTCNPSDWTGGERCSQEDIDRLDDDQNQNQDVRATFEMIRIGAIGEALNCPDVRRELPPIVRPVPTLSCTIPE